MKPGGVILCSARDRAEWLALRHGGIGASDMPKVLGVSRWGGPLALWEEKVGPPPRSDKPTGRQARGHAVEPLILQMVADRCGYVVHEDQKLRQHPDLTWMRATIDGRTDAWLVIECKSVAFASDLPEELPMDWEVQVQQQLAVAGATTGIVAALAVVDWELRCYPVRRDEELIDTVLIPRGEQFWGWVREGIEPAVDCSDESMAAWRRIHGRDDGSTVELPEEVLLDVYRWESAKRDAKEAGETAEVFKLRLQQAMGAAAYGDLPDGSQLTYKTEKSGRRVLRLKESRR